MRGCVLRDIEHGQEAVWRHGRDLLEGVQGQQILIATDDHLGMTADSHLEEFVIAGVAAGSDAPVRPDQLAVQEDQLAMVSTSR